jgi:ribosomal protein S18 acetylase RimI-like enzyme
MRHASRADAELVHAMIVEMAHAMDAKAKVRSTVEDIADAMSDENPVIHVILAERGAVAIGLTIFFLTFSTWRGTLGVYVQDIYVSPEGRGTGIGRTMLSKVAAWAAERGADHLRLSVDRDNTNAQAFYENIGMSYCDDEMIYRITGNRFMALGSAQ